jgi:uncharacterized protein YjiS (DUF1127 family)
MTTIHDADALPAIAPARVLPWPSTGGAMFLPFAVARGALLAGFERLLLWQDRATQRHRLGMAEDHVLADVGLTRADVALEIRKPFWRP